MKRFSLSWLLILLACASASAQNLFPASNCLANCGQYTGDCLACHITNDAEQWFADYTSYCPSCSSASAKVVPTVPFQAKPTDKVLAFLESMTVKRDPKLAQLMNVSPEKHIALMQRAAQLRLDGPMLGSCKRAFKVGTLAKLPAEIRATRGRLAMTDGDGPCINGMQQCADGTWVYGCFGCPILNCPGDCGCPGNPCTGGGSLAKASKK